MSDLETLIRNYAKAGDLNYLSVAMREDGLWEAVCRGVGDREFRTHASADPADALTKVIPRGKARSTRGVI